MDVYDVYFIFLRGKVKQPKMLAVIRAASWVLRAVTRGGGRFEIQQRDVDTPTGQHISHNLLNPRWDFPRCWQSDFDREGAM